MKSLPYKPRMVFDDPLAKQKVIEAALKKKQAIKDKYEKKQSYGKYIKEMHYPEVSHKKQKELNDLKLKLKHKARSPVGRVDMSKPLNLHDMPHMPGA